MVKKIETIKSFEALTEMWLDALKEWYDKTILKQRCSFMNKFLQRTEGFLFMGPLLLQMQNIPFIATITIFDAPYIFRVEFKTR